MEDNTRENNTITVVRAMELALEFNLQQINKPDIMGIDKRWWKHLPNLFQEQWHILSPSIRAALFIESNMREDIGSYGEDFDFS